MRTGVWLAAFVALLGVGSSGSADTVQTSTTTFSCTESCTNGTSALQPFDSSLGTLTGISLQVTGSKSDYFASYPADYTGTGSIDWSYAGPMSVVVNGSDYTFNISGGGTIPITGFSLGYTFAASGSGTFEIDPSLFSSFIGVTNPCNAFYPALIGVCVTAGPPPGFGATYTLNNAVPPEPTDDAVNASYTLTYAYTPFATAVPEPSTWAMMLLGFAAIVVRARRSAFRRWVPSPAETGDLDDRWRRK